VRDRTGRRGAALTAILLAWLLVAGCSTAYTPPAGPSAAPTSSRPPIPRVCVFERCRGMVGASEYAVDMPARWNGTLLLFVPGFYRVYPQAGGTPVALSTSPRTELARTLVERGYAVAGATYAWGGWSVAQSITAADVAYRYVTEHVGRPQRVYAWGQSMGGLVSVLLAERHPEWVSGVAPACGVLGGTTRFFDAALDVAYAVRTLLAPGLRLGRFGSYAQAAAAFTEGRRAVNRALTEGDARQKALLLLIGDLLHAPVAGAVTPAARVSAAAQSISSALGFATVVRWELERGYGGAVSTNAGVDYGSRVDTPERAVLDGVWPGVAESALAALAAGPRVVADPVARRRLGALSPAGAPGHPVVTLHDAQDPVAPLEHEGAYGALVAGHGQSGDLMQLVSVPPRSWTGALPPYGAGHCRFTNDEILGMLTVLNDWVTTGARPGPDAVREAFGANTGLDLGFAIPAWPGAR
jgi:hypothetical protein